MLASDLDALERLEGQWPNTGHVAVRFGLVVSFFFEEGRTTVARRRAVALARDYCERFADKVTHYQPPGSNRLRRIKSLDFLAAIDAKAQALSEADDFDLVVLGVGPDGDLERPVPWCVDVVAIGPFELSPADVSSADLYLPAAWLRENGVERLVELVAGWAEILRPSHGTAGFGTHFASGDSRQTPGLIAFPCLQRFPGLDYQDSVSWSVARGQETGFRIRTTNWLSFVSNAYLAALGGWTALAALPPSCRALAAADGALIVAGPEPRLFGEGAGVAESDYGAVARLLRPLRFDDFKPFASLFAFVPEPLDPVEESVRWVRRFDGA